MKKGPVNRQMKLNANNFHDMKIGRLHLVKELKLMVPIYCVGVHMRRFGDSC